MNSCLPNTETFTDIYIYTHTHTQFIMSIYIDIDISTYLYLSIYLYIGLPGGAVVKNLPVNAGDVGNTGLIPWSGRSPGVGNDNPLQYVCLENSMDSGAWQATVYEVTKSWT